MVVADLVEDGASLFLDTGTTCEGPLCVLCTTVATVRVVSYSLRIAAYLSEVTEFHHRRPGGFVRQVDGGIFSRAASVIQGQVRLGNPVSLRVDDAVDLGDDDQAR